MKQSRLHPVSFTRHKNLRWKRFTSYRFAAQETECRIVMKEASEVAAAFPIVFKETDRGVEPRALLSLRKKAANPFVTTDGRWLASYVPAALRCPPFQVAWAGNPLQCGAQLLVDETSDLLTSQPEDEPFFSDDGALSQGLQDVLMFLRAWSANHADTLKACHALAKMGLFKAVDHHGGINLPDGTLAISADRLDALAPTEKLELYETGALSLTFAHSISLSHCQWLFQAQERQARSEVQDKFTENSDVSGFLGAVANAQRNEFFETGEMSITHA